MQELIIAGVAAAATLVVAAFVVVLIVILRLGRQADRRLREGSTRSRS